MSIGITWRACSIPRLMGPTQEFLIHKVWGGAQGFAYLTNSQVMLRLLVLGPHFENCREHDREQRKRREPAVLALCKMEKGKGTNLFLSSQRTD